MLYELFGMAVMQNYIAGTKINKYDFVPLEEAEPPTAGLLIFPDRIAKILPSFVLM